MLGSTGARLHPRSWSKTLGSGLLLLLFALPGEGQPAAQASPDAAVLKCREIEDSLVRLRCYDELADRLADGSPTSKDPLGQASSMGAWVVEETTNPLDDSTTVVASLPAIEGKGSLGGPVTLFIRCESGKTEVFILWAESLGISADVVSRFDQEQPTSRTWNVSTNHRATFFPANAVPQAAKIAASSRWVVQVPSGSGGRTTAIFDLAGADVAVSRVSKACRW